MLTENVPLSILYTVLNQPSNVGAHFVARAFLIPTSNIFIEYVSAVDWIFDAIAPRYMVRASNLIAI